MKHFRIFLFLLVLALVLSGCAQEPEAYSYNVSGRSVNVFPDSGTIVDGLNVYRYTRSEGHGGEIFYEITYPNGGRYYWTKTKTGGQGGGEGVNDSLYLPGSTLVRILEAGEPEKKLGSPILGLLLIALGAWHILSPESVFYLRKGWMFKQAEPSDGYITLARVSGGAFALLGLILCFI